MIRFTILVSLLCTLCASKAQDRTKELIQLNQAIDQSVVDKNISFLRDHYADDFVFTHGTGLVEGKNQWLNNVAKPAVKYISRTHDSVLVESHQKNIAVLYGRLEVLRQDKDTPVHYGLWYIRVYTKLHRRWQMVSHRTVKEWHY